MDYKLSKKMRDCAGWRERYAMDHGVKTVIYVNGNKCYKFTYSEKEEYQDANGATFDTARCIWID